jgi:hypothetical protein
MGCGQIMQMNGGALKEARDDFSLRNLPNLRNLRF